VICQRVVSLRRDAANDGLGTIPLKDELKGPRAQVENVSLDGDRV
jgi:hypothetical protein